jgi:hypothetical protein
VASSTEYLILRRGADGAWAELDGSVTASGSSKARRAAAEAENIDGEYVAVPVRSWHPEPFSFETVRRLVRGSVEANGRSLEGNTTSSGAFAGASSGGPSA